jgi:hypothetical protein
MIGRNVIKLKTNEYCENRKKHLRYRLIWLKIISSVMKIECNICGYNKCWHALHFHHKDPKDKNFTISSMMRKKPNKKNIELMKKELKKCVCLCATHHMEEHVGNYDLIIHKQRISNLVGLSNED